jgi:hypothetical protein
MGQGKGGKLRVRISLSSSMFPQLSEEGKTFILHRMRVRKSSSGG